MIRTRLLLPLLLAGLIAGCAPARNGTAPADFATLVSTLSEPGGYFDTDNLVSNESAYLHVMDALEPVKGGAYLGVGPEQNFSYIAEVEPAVAVLIDIRRDNLLLHLLFKALFEAAETRIEYLALLFGRPVPPDPSAWRGRDLDSLLDYIERTPAGARNASDRLKDRIARMGIPLSAEDTATIGRFHLEFIARGPQLAFSTFGRPAVRPYPTMRRLYLETDLQGRQRSYLASEARWRRVRTMQTENRVIPVIGDLAGSTAMPAIARYLGDAGLTLTAIYASNVEFYLMRAGTFPAWVANVRALPTDRRTIMIRSWFDRGFGGEGMQPGHFSSQHTQTVEHFLEQASKPGLSYRELVEDGAPALQQ